MTDLVSEGGIQCPDIGRPWPLGGLERVKACPVCTSTERSLLHDRLTDRVFFCAPGKWSLYECRCCRSAYLDPRPTPETIHIAYGHYFTHADPQGPMATATLSGARRFRRALANGYRNWRYGSRFKPASRLGVLAAWFCPAWRCVVDSEFRHISRAWPGARLLDVGAGNGGFLVQARGVGWEVVGAEPDPTALAVARRAGLDIREGGIERFADEPNSFDVITISHVIEHVHDPRRVLAQASSSLKPGGCLYLDTPNISSFGHTCFGRDWLHLDPPRHLVLFNWASLESLLLDVGFGRIKRLVQSHIYVNSAAASRAVRIGCDPISGRTEPTLGDRLISWAIRAWTPFRYKDSEFVTLMAFKMDEFRP